MSRAPIVDVIIAVHDPTRPVQRAVASVLEPGLPVRVSVICHGIPVDSLAFDVRVREDERLRFVEFSDGIRSPAGPFNHGIDLATAEYVAVMGSDDFLEHGAMRRWIRWVSTEKPDVLIAGIRHQGGSVVRNPLVRLGRRRNLDARRDRLFYRAAPLGLIRRSLLQQAGLRFTEGFQTGEDLAVSAWLWASASRVDYAGARQSYVIGSDAVSRVSFSPLSARDVLEPVHDLLGRRWIAALPEPIRRSLAIALLRINLLGALLARPDRALWQPEDIDAVRATLAAINALAPDVLDPLPRADRRLLDAVSEERVSPGTLTQAIRQHRSSSRLDRLLTKSPSHALDREGVPVRYLLYFLEEWASRLQVTLGRFRRRPT